MNIDDIVKTVDEAGSQTVSKEEIELEIWGGILSAGWKLKASTEAIYEDFSMCSNIFGFEIYLDATEHSGSAISIESGLLRKYELGVAPKVFAFWSRGDSNFYFHHRVWDFFEDRPSDAHPIISHVRDMILARKQKAIFEAACSEHSGGSAKTANRL